MTKMFLLSIVLFSIAGGLLLAGGGLGGAWLACNNGGGSMTGFSCVSLDVLGVCEWQGEYYYSPGVVNVSFDLGGDV